jgi:hypothetical protein
MHIICSLPHLMAHSEKVPVIHIYLPFGLSWAAEPLGNLV